MRTALYLCIAMILAGCEAKGPYPLTFEKILAQQRALPGEIYLVQGSKFGLFKEGAGAVGNENTSGSLRNMDGYEGSQPPAKWPATPGYYYEATSYVNELSETLYVVRKIPAK